MGFPVAAAVGGALGLGNLINSAIQGGKQDDIMRQALALEQARERDRSMLRDLFMKRVAAAPSPEQAVYDAQQQAAGIYGANDPMAPGRANPFSSPMAAPSGDRPLGALAGEDLERLKWDAGKRVGYLDPEQAARRGAEFQGAGAMGGIKSGYLTPEEWWQDVGRFNEASPKKAYVPDNTITADAAEAARKLITRWQPPASLPAPTSGTAPVAPEDPQARLAFISRLLGATARGMR